MNKIYIGDQEINTGGSGGGQEFNPSDYVDASTWNEHEKVIASALVNLKGLEDQIEAFDESIQAQETALLAEVHVVEQQKADASTVYTKNDIDKSDKVVAAALASLNERVTTLETSSGGSGESGDSFDPEYLELDLADVSARVYDAENDILDVSDRLDFLGDLTLDISSRVDALEASSGGQFDPSDINASIGDISTRVKAIEDDYVVTNDISAFVKENDISVFVTHTALDASYNALDASIIALDASALAFDASIKELAEGGGGGGDAAFVKYTNTSDSTKVGIVSALSTSSSKGTIGNGAVLLGSGSADGNNSFSGGDQCLAGAIGSFAFGQLCRAEKNFSVAFGQGSGSNTGAKAQFSFIQGRGDIAYGRYSHTEGNGCKTGSASKPDDTYDYLFSHAEGYQSWAIAEGSHAEGRNTSTGINGQSGAGKFSHAEGYNTNTLGESSHAEGEGTKAGYYANYVAYGNYSHAEGGYTRTYLNYEHAAGYYNSCSSTGGNTFGSDGNTLSTIGNGASDSSRHNAFEVRQSGDIYVADVSAEGEYYEKPMINLQQKIYELEARIAALENS